MTKRIGAEVVVSSLPPRSLLEPSKLIAATSRIKRGFALRRRMRSSTCRIEFPPDAVSPSSVSLASRTAEGVSALLTKRRRFRPSGIAALTA